MIAFLAHRIARRDWVVSRTVAVAAGFFVAFLIVYLVGFFNLETTFDRNLFIKGITKWGINFALLLCAVAYLERRSPRIYWETLAAFVAGFAVNAAWGLAQLVLAEGGTEPRPADPRPAAPVREGRHQHLRRRSATRTSTGRPR